MTISFFIKILPTICLGVRLSKLPAKLKHTTFTAQIVFMEM